MEVEFRESCFVSMILNEFYISRGLFYGLEEESSK